MFERLTHRSKYGIAYTKIAVNESNMVDVGECYTGRIIDRLAAYEDIGLTPEEVTEMINRFESFVSEMTGNRMSKSSYTVKAMVDAAEDYQQSLCEECWDRKQLAKHHEMERDGRCVVLDEEMVIRAVEKAILVNSDEKKYRYELGKDCLIPCCQDAYKYLIAEREKGAEHDRD